MTISRKGFAFVALALLLPISEVCAQDSRSLNWYQSVTTDVLNNARRLIRKNLPSDEKRIERSIDFQVTSDPAFIAEASSPDGKPQVVISAGAIQAIEFMADAIVFEELGATGCVEDYSIYWSDNTIRNTARYEQGLSVEPVASPALYAQEGDNNCEWDPEEFAADAEMQEMKSRMMEASIMYLYLHELGHHVKGHVESNVRDKAFIREQEDEADRYAFETAIQSNYSLLAATPLMVIISGIGGNSLEAEQKSTHPLGIRRYLTLVNESIEYYSENPDALPPGADTLVSDLEDFASELEGNIDDLN